MVKARDAEKEKDDKKDDAKEDKKEDKKDEKKEAKKQARAAVGPCLPRQLRPVWKSGSCQRHKAAGLAQLDHGMREHAMQ